MTSFRSKFHLFELFGIPVFVDISFAILLLMFTTSSGSFTKGLAFALVLAVSVVLHELGHALTAGAFGYRTDSITISLLGGCASLIALPRKATQEFLTAIAGPAVSFALAAAGVVALSTVASDGSALSLVWHLLTGSIPCETFGSQLYFFDADALPASIGVSNWQAVFLDAAGQTVCPVFACAAKSRWLVDACLDISCMNAMLGAFNLLPGFPMDGGRVFRSTMRAFMNRAKATYVAMWVGRGFAILLALSGLAAMTGGGSWGLVRILIAWMIWREGYREYQLALYEDTRHAWTQADFGARVSPPPYDRD